MSCFFTSRANIFCLTTAGLMFYTHAEMKRKTVIGIEEMEMFRLGGFFSFFIGVCPPRL